MNNLENQDELLAAFIDGKTTRAESLQVLESMMKDPEQAEIYEIVMEALKSVQEEKEAASEKSLAEQWNLWIESLEGSAKVTKQQEDVKLAAASKDELNERASKGNFEQSLHLENEEEGIQVDVDRMEGEKMLEAVIRSKGAGELKSLEVLSQDGERIELGKIEENSYAKIDLVKLRGKLVIATKEDKLIELKLK